MSWYAWESEAAFDVWHERVIAMLNLPRVGENQRTGEPAPDKQKTTAYTQPVVVADDDVRAFVESDVAGMVPEGLGVASDKPPSPLEEF